MEPHTMEPHLKNTMEPRPKNTMEPQPMDPHTMKLHIMEKTKHPKNITMENPKAM